MGDTTSANVTITEAIREMKVVSAIAERKDIRMTSPVPPHNAHFELEDPPDQARRLRLLVPTRQALEEAVEGRAANRLHTTKSDTDVPDPFFFNHGFLSEYLSTKPAQEAVAGTYNVQRPYSEEFGYFSSDGMFASAYTRYMLPAPDAEEGVLPGFGIYELVSGFHALLHTCFDFFKQHCVDVDLDTAWTPGPLLFIETNVEDTLFVEATHCHTAERARIRFQQFRERCGADSARATRIRLSRWNFYDVILKAVSQAVPFQKRNQVTALTRQIMRLITQEKHEMQMTRHVRALCAEIKSLANKMEVLHVGKDMGGEPLFGGRTPIPYTVQGVKEAFRRGAALQEQEQPVARKSKASGKGFGRGGQAKASAVSDAISNTSPHQEAQATVERIFRDQMLTPEVEQALSDLIVRGKFLRETSAFIPEPPPQEQVQPVSQRGTRILGLIFESPYDWAPILRRIAGYIYTPAFDRLYLPVIVQTQVPHQTRAQRKVGVRFSFLLREAPPQLRHEVTVVPPRRGRCAEITGIHETPERGGPQGSGRLHGRAAVFALKPLDAPAEPPEAGRWGTRETALLLETQPESSRRRGRWRRPASIDCVQGQRPVGRTRPE